MASQPAEEEMKEIEQIGVDIIENLHRRNMYLVLKQIFEKLDRESLMNVELTSQAWKAAISNVNLSMFWNIQFQQKFANSLLWDKLYRFNVEKGLDFASKDFLFPRILFNKIQYTVETITKNWTECDSTNNYIQEDRMNSVKSIQITDKYVSILFDDFKSKIWNRHTLKVEQEIQTAEEHGCCVLYEDVFMHTHGQQITVRHLRTKKEEIFPTPIDGNNYIARLFAANGFLVAGLNLKYNGGRSRLSHTAIIWKIKSPFEIEWNNFQMVPSLNFYQVFMDKRFLIFEYSHHVDSKVFDVRQMSEPREKGKVFEIASCYLEHIYHDGFIFWDSSFSGSTTTISMLDIESGNIKTVNLLADNSNKDVQVNIDSGFLLACCECGEQWFLTTKLQVWDLKTIMDSSTSSQIIQPLIDISVCPLPFIRSVSTMSLHSDILGIVCVSEVFYSPYVRSSYAIRTISFLPACNFCKEIRKNLRRCERCNLVKYCDSDCQQADWDHHKELCLRKKDVSVLNELSEVKATISAAVGSSTDSAVGSELSAQVISESSDGSLSQQQEL
uniref:MYND-type domain-containing protein n=1 Tax=Daphnia galeata TaxID=27404 RepID=A0A8J2RD29_9CRUS|nr:unnamed protein product [Daphnia galeata]